MSKSIDGSAGASLQALIRTGEVCRCLRSKKLFYQDETDASDAANSAPFWCAQTQSLLGPDSKVASVDACRPGRSCCETT